MNEEEKRSFYRSFAFIGGLITFLMLIMVGFYLSIVVRMTSAQRLYSFLTAGLIGFVFFVGYIFFIGRHLRIEIEALEGAEGEEKIRRIERTVALPARFSFIAFLFWVFGSFICATIFYLFLAFSSLQSIEAFFLAMCGGFFAPLLMYYLYKDKTRKFLKNLDLKIDYKSYQRFLSFSLPLKVTFPFVVSILITFILIITLSLRMRDDLISGVLKSIGEKELSLMKTVETQGIGGKIIIDPNDVKGKIEETIAELSKKGKKIYIDPSTMNIFVFEKSDGGRIESFVYSWKNLVRYPTPWNRAIWLLALFSLGILILIPYLVIRDLKSSVDDVKDFLERRERPVPSDDEFNYLFFALLKFSNEFDLKVREARDNVEVMERRFSGLLDFIKFVEENLRFFEEVMEGIRKHAESEKVVISSLRNFLNESRDFFNIGDEEGQIDAKLKNNKEVSEEIISLIGGSIEEGKKFCSSLEGLEKLKSDDLPKRIDVLKEGSHEIRRIKELSSIYKETLENILKIRELLFSLDLKIKESKNFIKKFGEEIKGVSKSIENVKGDSEKIGEIARVIKEIIEETNLLSLNASIIAAQAGEKGKSFAVVAEEIKELAERTEMSTGEINHIVFELQRFIENSVDKIGEIYNFALEFTRDFDYLEEKFKIVGSDIERVGNSFSRADKILNEISAFCSYLDDTAKALEDLLPSIGPSKKYGEYVKRCVSLMEKAFEFIITSQNFLGDQASFVKKIREKSGAYLEKLEGIKGSFSSLDIKISEIGNSLERIVKLINNMKIKIKEVR